MTSEKYFTSTKLHNWALIGGRSSRFLLLRHQLRAKRPHGAAKASCSGGVQREWGW